MCFSPRRHPALSEDQSLVPSTDIRWLATTLNGRSKESDTLYHLRHLNSLENTHMDTHVIKSKNLKNTLSICYQCLHHCSKKTQHTVLPRESSHIKIALKRLSMDKPHLGVSKPIVEIIGSSLSLLVPD